MLTATTLFAAGALHFDEAATEQRTIGDPLDRLGTGIALYRGALGPRGRL
jgi:hypothetical protein